ncbi:vitamin K epoxide reductase-like protein [Fragilaria crotonensis]|nr:vitamin K epoxide reductase-like protein [Fragilaria crotonensis]
MKCTSVPRISILILQLQLYVQGWVQSTGAFSVQLQHSRINTFWRLAPESRSFASSRDELEPESASNLINSDGTSQSCYFNPELRKIMAGVAGLGAAETAYLTASKLSGQSVLCAVDGSCQDVLNGPYAVIPFTDNVPLSALGCMAYTLTAIVAIAPLLVQDKEDTVNRIVLLILATGLGTFSTFLMALLVTVLHESCLYCLASASLSWTLAATAWFGGALPEGEHRIPALQSSVATVIATAAASVLLFANVEGSSADTTVASLPPQSPPAITTSSSPQALAIGKDLVKLNAKMYGAYWCSHCYDQKQSLGKQAFYESVQYIECSKEGVNSQAPVCKERNVPGYPTWEISGQLFPGEQDLDELQDIIDKVKAGK